MVNFKLITKPGIYSKIADRLKKTLTTYDNITGVAPNYIVVVGGDGTILYAEREYPHVPKITFRDSEVGSKCRYSLNDFEKVIKKVLHIECHNVYENKLCLKKYNLFALNEIQLHNKLPTSAVRFSIEADGDPIFTDVIGDGVIIATPFGSTGYYKSLGGRPFKNAFGIALNNPSNMKRDHKLVPLTSTIKIKMHRGNGIIVLDNNEKFIDANEDYGFEIGLADHFAQFVKIEE